MSAPEAATIGNEDLPVEARLDERLTAGGAMRVTAPSRRPENPTDLQNVQMKEVPAKPKISGFKALSAGNLDKVALEEEMGTPSYWEKFVEGDLLPPAARWFPCCCITTFVLILVVLGALSVKMSDGFGFFVPTDKQTQAFFAHNEYLKDRTYWSDICLKGDTCEEDATAYKRQMPVPLATIFLEVKGTKCPGEECSLTSKNAITPKYLGYIKKIEEKIWNNKDFQEKYSAILGPPRIQGNTMVYPPKSPLDMLLWNQGAAALKSKAMYNDFWPGNPCKSITPGNWQSPWDNQVAFNQPKCKFFFWSHVVKDSGADAPGELSSYASAIDRMCTQDDHWAATRPTWLPTFACKDGHMKKNGIPFIRSELLLGLPYDNDTKQTSLDIYEQVDKMKDKYGADFFKLQNDILKDVLGDGDDDINLIIDSGLSNGAKRQALQMQTMGFAVLSFFLVFLYMWFNVESVFLAMFGMLQVLFSVFPTFLVWSFINQQGVQFLQFLAVFMILGIGADDTFVLNDAYKQAKHELAEVGDVSHLNVFCLAYRRAFSAMLATTLTTALAFFFGILNPIPAIADFCIFACIIVIWDFLFCITMFAACVAFNGRYLEGNRCLCCGGKPEPGTCCQPGCCWGGTRILWRTCRRIPHDQTTNSRALEEFFAGPLTRHLKKMKFCYIIFWLLLLVLAGVAIALGVKVADKDPQGMPEDHPDTRLQKISKAYFTQPTSERVNVVWGLSHDGAVGKWSATKALTPEKSEIKMGDINAAITPEGQKKILALCTAPDTVAGTRCFEKSCLVKGSAKKGPCAMKTTADGKRYFADPLCQSGRYCIMESVKDYADYKCGSCTSGKYKWPLADFNAVVTEKSFKEYMGEILRTDNQKEGPGIYEKHGQHWHSPNFKRQTGFVFDPPGKVKYMWMSFNATFEGAFLPPKEGNQIFDDWQDFVKKYVDGTKFYQVHVMYVFKVLQDVLVSEAFKSIGCSLGVAFATLALVTWNWYISLLGLFNLIAIMVYFIGLWPILGWELDIYNVIFCIMAVGLSVDYTVHLLHAYNERHETAREDRAAGALASMGITVASGALTTLLAAIPLMATIPTFFNRFGTFVFITIFLAIFASVFFLVPMLIAIGPNGPAPDSTGMQRCCTFGEISFLYALRDMMCKKKK